MSIEISSRLAVILALAIQRSRSAQRGSKYGLRPPESSGHHVVTLIAARSTIRSFLWELSASPSALNWPATHTHQPARLYSRAPLRVYRQAFTHGPSERGGNRLLRAVPAVAHHQRLQP